VRDGTRKIQRMDAFEFRIGQRVKVRRDPDDGPGPWPAEPTGVVERHPNAVTGEVSVRTETLLGPTRMYWIAFDVPQHDTDGDGPYAVSEVQAKYIEAED
jgi:hypothetical protein